MQVFQATVLLLLLAVRPAVGQAPPPPWIEGRVVSAIAGAPLADALVYPVGSGASAAVMTTPSGRFRLRARDGDRLMVLRVGYRADTVVVADGRAGVVTLAPAALQLAPVLVSAERGDAEALRRQLAALTLGLRPRTSAQELLRLGAGVSIAQHGGGGKAEQIFVRGFDSDHGTDLAVAVDGTPVNLVSHAHGQGYTDLHFLPPEVVAAVELRRGGLDARDGNLATAGSIQLTTRDRSPAWTELRFGSFNSRGLHVGVPWGGDATRWGGYTVATWQLSDGPFLAPQDFRRRNLFVKASGPLARSAELVASGSWYDASWMASGQIPERAVRQGLISRFGSLDSTEGGTTRRAEASVALRSQSGALSWQARAYSVRYDLDLFSNFTFFLRDSTRGDGIEQVDGRWVSGLSLDGTLPAGGGALGATSAGLGFRQDLIDLLLAGQRARVRGDTLSASRVVERHLSAWASQGWSVGPIALTTGLRADLFAFRVEDRAPAGTAGADGPVRAAGSRTVARVSPRVQADLALSSALSLRLGAGLGLHSNDARDQVVAGRSDETVPRSTTLEAGVRWVRAGVVVDLTAFHTDLTSELVWVGDEGRTEPSGPTRRGGLELDGQVRMQPWLWADLDVALVRARVRGAPAGEDEVPLAPRRTMSAGLLAQGDGPWEAGLRVRHVGSRPADETGQVTALGHSLVELTAAWRRGCVRVVGTLDNMLNATWNEAQFATTSRLAGELAPTTELHYTPGAPRSVTVGFKLSCGP